MDTPLYPNFPNAYYYGHEGDEISIEDFESFVKHPFNNDILKTKDDIEFDLRYLAIK